MIGRRLRFRGLFRKYFLVLFLAVVVPLATNGVSEAWLGYHDQRARLNQLLGSRHDRRLQNRRLHRRHHHQLDWLVQLPWSEKPDEQRRIDALRLLRQVPAIVSLTLVDGTGRERLYVSRIGLNRTENRTDRSAERGSRGRALGPESGMERSATTGVPSLTLTVAISGNRPSVGVVVAEVNLKLIWDVISAIKVGETGYAFVLDGPGRLVAHPDISLVLRGADEATLAPFRPSERHRTCRGGSRDGSGHPGQRRCGCRRSRCRP